MHVDTYVCGRLYVNYTMGKNSRVQGVMYVIMHVSMYITYLPK